MPYTQSQYDALQAALASGTLSVRFDNREIVYRSTADLEKALAIVQAGIASQNGTQSNRQVRIYTTKGFGNPTGNG